MAERDPLYQLTKRELIAKVKVADMMYRARVAEVEWLRDVLRQIAVSVNPGPDDEGLSAMQMAQLAHDAISPVSHSSQSAETAQSSTSGGEA